MAEEPGRDNSQWLNLMEGRDFYYEGPYMVFTAEYLRRRGYCCGSGCRHCPYKEDERKEAERKRSEKNS